MNSVVIDANLAVYAVLPNPRHEQAVRFLESLIENDASIFVPHLWFYEVTTAIRKSLIHTGVTSQTALYALQAVLALPVETIPEDSNLYIRAYQYAEELGHLAVYDAAYLALAERAKTDFYTADQRLFNRCQEIGISFVKQIV